MTDHELGYRIFKLRIKHEPDIVTARQKTRSVAQLLGFTGQDRSRLSTAVSELARNVYQYASGGTIEFFFSDSEIQTLFVSVVDQGPGIREIKNILNGTYVSSTGMGVGIGGSKKLVDHFRIETNDGKGTKITIGKNLDRQIRMIKRDELPGIAAKMSMSAADSPFEEIQNQNRELIEALEDARLARHELTSLNGKLKVAYKNADSASQAKSRFLSNMSHEIRTPLGVILGFAELALDPASKVSDRNSYLETLKRNAQHLNNLIGEILDLAKVEAGKINLETIDFSLPSLMLDLVEAFKLQATSKGVNLSLRFEGSFPDYVISDPTRIRQVLTNLINNALKFTEAGTVEVVVVARNRDPSSETVMIEVSVKDSGIGIPPEGQAHLFEAFMQADSSMTRRFGGTGLGLTLSRGLAEALGGRLFLHSSEQNVGSTFCFYFRINVAANTKFQLNRSATQREIGSLHTFPSEGALLGMSVLLVEDSTDNQLLFIHYLKKSGAVVEVASDGREGVKKAQGKVYDAILMDVQMPVLDGYEATKQLRDFGVETPIIALTAHALKEDRDRALSSGFSGYLIKPLDPRLLIDTLAELRT